jgi:hypothetical protein
MLVDGAWRDALRLALAFSSSSPASARMAAGVCAGVHRAHRRRADAARKEGVYLRRCAGAANAQRRAT